MHVDRDLVEAARRGDREAYADLIRVRGDRLFAIAQRILRDVDRTVPMGSVTAKQVELTVAHSLTYSCAGHGSFYVGLLTQPIDGGPNEYGLPSSQRQLMTVVDVGDQTVVMQSYARPFRQLSSPGNRATSATSSPRSASNSGLARGEPRSEVPARRLARIFQR
jgi:hypothetical protein